MYRFSNKYQSTPKVLKIAKVTIPKKSDKQRELDRWEADKKRDRSRSRDSLSRDGYSSGNNSNRKKRGKFDYNYRNRNNQRGGGNQNRNRRFPHKVPSLAVNSRQKRTIFNR